MTTRRCDTIFEASLNSKPLGESVMKLPPEEKRYKELKKIRPT
jgi:hypothetical protein